MSQDHGAYIIAQSWRDAIRLNLELGATELVLYVSLNDWNQVARSLKLETAEARRLPQVTSFVDNPVMVVPELPDGVSYLGQRIMP